MTVDDLMNKVMDRAQRAADDFGNEVQDDVQNALSIAYPPASAPGEKPHKRTGKLRSLTLSLPARNYTISSDKLTVEIVSGAEYAEFLENGTSRMKARPFMGPTEDKWAPRWGPYMKAAIQGG